MHAAIAAHGAALEAESAAVTHSPPDRLLEHAAITLVKCGDDHVERDAGGIGRQVEDPIEAGRALDDAGSDVCLPAAGPGDLLRLGEERPALRELLLGALSLTYVAEVSHEGGRLERPDAGDRQLDRELAAVCPHANELEP